MVPFCRWGHLAAIGSLSHLQGWTDLKVYTASTSVFWQMFVSILGRRSTFRVPWKEKSTEKTWLLPVTCVSLALSGHQAAMKLAQDQYYRSRSMNCPPYSSHVPMMQAGSAPKSPPHFHLCPAWRYLATRHHIDFSYLILTLTLTLTNEW